MAHHPFPWQDAFLAALRQMPVVRHACEAVGINRSTAYDARNRDPVFSQAWDDAMEDGIDRAEQEAMRRGVTGYEEPVVYKGHMTPLYEHDEHGNIVEEAYDTGLVDDEGFPRMAMRPKPLLIDGKPQVLTVRKHSDALLSLVLKGRRKQVYADRTELTGADGGALQLDETTKAARLSRLLTLAQARKDAEDIA